MTDLDVYDHVRLTGTDHPDGVYRVVGVRDAEVTVLRVGDADGQRVHSGELGTLGVDELEAATSAPNPDGNRPLRATVRAALTMPYWVGRAFVQQLLARPGLSALAVSLVLVGVVGGQTGQIPGGIESGMILVGGLALAYLGSGRSS
ncbi:hypothetical protein [Halovenus marina]|uniref:hypothetical protein n=1 Tax=Halovenus marina TaxID=3396621 RepID=UPI003F55D244